MTATAAPVPNRAPWRRLAVGLVAFVLFSFLPQVRAALPIEQTALMLAAVVAVCAVIGWMKGGRASLPLIWIAICGLMLMTSIGPVQGSYTWMARGWILLVAASFGLVSMLAASEAFFPRALSALAISIALAFGVVLATPGGTETVSGAMSTEFNRRVAQSNASLREATSQPGWKEIVERTPAFQEVTENSEAQLATISKWSILVVPALLALESLAALALGWSLYHRMSEVAIGPKLGKLRDFRFNDQLVWGIAVGASIFLLKAFAEGKNAGLNLLVFFGFLYALRGMGILAWMAHGRALRLMLVVAAIFAWPIMTALAFGIGLGDTWLDWRSRAQTKPG